MISGLGWMLRRVLIALGVLLVSGFMQLAVTDQAVASTRRLHVFQFNACDQYGTSHPSTNCRYTPWYERADAIVASINNWSADVVTLQEVCQSTYQRIMGQLPGWHGYFKHTYVTSASDNRCGSGPDYWGIAVMAKSTLSSISYTLLGTESNGEERRLLCANVTVGSGFRLCSTHLSTSSANVEQVRKVAAELNGWVSNGAAVLLGGDLNINVRSCAEDDYLAPFYYGAFGAGNNSCRTGYGHFYEADKATSWGDGVYDEVTTGSEKLDYVFVNRQRFYADYGADATSSSVSDHRPLRAAVTVHD